MSEQKQTAGEEQALHGYDPIERQSQIAIDIYVAPHCSNCAYAYEVAAAIRSQFPQVRVCIIDLADTTAVIPTAVFATPTYLLNGRVWSLGNPSPAKIQETLATLRKA